MNAKRNREESLRLSHEVRRRIEAEREYEFERKLRQRQIPEQGIARLRTLVSRDYPASEPSLFAQLRRGDRRLYGKQLRTLRAQVDLQLRLHRQLSAHQADFEGLVVLRLRVELAFARLALAPWVQRFSPAWAESLLSQSERVLQPIWDPGTAR